MKRRNCQREELIYELSKKNRSYQYVRFTKYLSPQNWEAEAKMLAQDLKI